MGWYTAALSAGYAIGAFAGGAAADRVGLEPALAIIGALPALAALLVLPMPAIAAPPNLVPRAPGLRGLIAAHRRVDPRVWVAFLIARFIHLLSVRVELF